MQKASMTQKEKRLIIAAVHGPLSSNRQHYHIDDSLEDNREDY